MTHTKSELKRALSVCANIGSNCRAGGCPYYSNSASCLTELTRDALECIMELEARIAELEKEAKQE